MDIDDLAALLNLSKEEIVKKLNNEDVISVSLSEKESKKRREEKLLVL